jgi:hypothetical protein
MELSTIVIILFMVIVIVYLLLWIFSKKTQLTNMAPANVQQTIIASTIPVNRSNSNNYTYSTWFYINDWSSQYGVDKILLSRQDTESNVNPKITIGAMTNNASVTVTCYQPSNGDATTSSDYMEEDDGTTAAVASDSSTSTTFTCSVENIPLQKWVNMIVSLYGRTLDIYIDGKLVRTCILPGVAKVAAGDILVTPAENGFDGWTTNIKYWTYAVNPQTAYSIYKNGLGGSILGNILNKFRIRVSFIKDNKEKTSFEI